MFEPLFDVVRTAKSRRSRLSGGNPAAQCANGFPFDHRLVRKDASLINAVTRLGSSGPDRRRRLQTGAWPDQLVSASAREPGCPAYQNAGTYFDLWVRLSAHTTTPHQCL
jgi:hypothetical protein